MTEFCPYCGTPMEEVSLRLWCPIHGFVYEETGEINEKDNYKGYIG